jgi:hypothetical protein
MKGYSRKKETVFRMDIINYPVPFLLPLQPSETTFHSVETTLTPASDI